MNVDEYGKLSVMMEKNGKRMRRMISNDSWIWYLRSSGLGYGLELTGVITTFGLVKERTCKNVVYGVVPFFVI